jgi:hypothetical protein
MRLIIRCERPQGPRDEGLAWLRAQLIRVAVDTDIQSVAVTELEDLRGASPALPLLIECELAEGCELAGLTDRRPLAEFLSELRSLRLSPTVALGPEPVGLIDTADRT